jgi:hypothetical protein
MLAQLSSMSLLLLLVYLYKYFNQYLFALLICIDNICFYEKMGVRSMDYGQDLLYIRDSYQQLRGQKFVSNRMSYIILRNCWCDIIILNVHASTEDKRDVMKGQRKYFQTKNWEQEFPRN